MVALSAGTLKGDAIKNHNDETLGELEEIVIDVDAGKVAYGVLASGGFLGMGEKFFAIPWEMLTVDTDEKVLRLDLDKEIFEEAPGFDKDDWPDPSDLEYTGTVYEYYSIEPYWLRVR
jgi:sporulation protein YlmC with PRC-barrel domain